MLVNLLLVSCQYITVVHFIWNFRCFRVILQGAKLLLGHSKLDFSFPSTYFFKTMRGRGSITIIMNIIKIAMNIIKISSISLNIMDMLFFFLQAILAVGTHYYAPKHYTPYQYLINTLLYCACANELVVNKSRRNNER